LVPLDSFSELLNGNASTNIGFLISGIIYVKELLLMFCNAGMQLIEFTEAVRDR